MSSNPKIHNLKICSKGTLSQAIRLHITVIVLASPHKSTLRFDHIGNHIVDQSMFIPQFLLLEFLLVCFFIDSLEGIFEPAIVFLQNGILGCHVERIIPLQGKLETAMSETFNTLVSVVHTQANTTLSVEVIHFHLLLAPVIAFEGDLEFAWLIHDKICGLVLVTECMSSDDNRFFPARYQPRNILDDDGLPKDSSVQDVSDGTVGALPHLLEFELCNSSLIRCNGGTFDPYLALPDSISGINGNLVVGGIPMLNAKIEVPDVEIKERKDELVLNCLPNDASHLITIELGHGIGDFDFLEIHQKDMLFIYINIK